MLPIPDGVHMMPNFGCCSQGLLFNGRQRVFSPVIPPIKSNDIVLKRSCGYIAQIMIGGVVIQRVFPSEET